MTVEVELLNSRRLWWCLYFDPTVGINLVPGDLMAVGGQVLYDAVVGLTKNQVVPPVDTT